LKTESLIGITNSLILFFFDGEFCDVENLVKSSQKINQNLHETKIPNFLIEKKKTLAIIIFCILGFLFQFF
jgi:hypothetical protein